jgi:uncharacterized protein (TIGR00730 family)
MTDPFDKPRRGKTPPRHEPLPEGEIKPAQDDPGAPARVQALLASPTYRQADQDFDFLHLEHTIVVFGSTRIKEPAAAARHVEALREQVAAIPDDPALSQRLAIAERLLEKSCYYDVARELGRLVGASGGATDCRVLLVTGGGPGIMEAANRGAFDAGAPSIGLNIALPLEQFPNPYLAPDLCFRFHYFAMRKLHFVQRARALVAFPGGYGTFDEMFETLTLVQTRTIEPVPIVLVGRRYWEQAFDIDFLVAEGVVDPEDRDLFWFAETAEEIWSGILRWHERNGSPLVTPGCGP